jgi:hypothetical protein
MALPVAAPAWAGDDSTGSTTDRSHWHGHGDGTGTEPPTAGAFQVGQQGLSVCRPLAQPEFIWVDTEYA